MAQRKKSLRVGDVITSPKFALCNRECANERNRDWGHGMQANGFFKVHEPSGEGHWPAKTNAQDPNRGEARFVVEVASREYDDACGSSLEVVARRLFTTGRYNPRGELLYFHVGDPTQWENSVELREIQVVGKMKRRFV